MRQPERWELPLEIIMVMERATPDFELNIRLNGQRHKFRYKDIKKMLSDMRPFKRRGLLFFSVPNPAYKTGS